MQLKQTLVTLALCAAAAAASATTYTIGSLPIAPSAYSNVASVSGPSFSDTYDFSFPLGASTSSASAVTIDVGSLLNINGLTIQLFDAANTLLQVGSSGEASTLFDVPLLSGASYHFEVTGQVAGSGGGLYTFVATAAPVPEPETWALMLGGLAAIGFLILRRRSN
ncbi:FxDxF family PEP-CTERM protein [Aquabacterium sp.]|uniref:FxDxF family PEP-CTERM protein n=1 Tax=Aquabacterium sp. TaxID=1872578 RepID=UPI0037843253